MIYVLNPPNSFGPLIVLPQGPESLQWVGGWLGGGGDQACCGMVPRVSRVLEVQGYSPKVQGYSPLILYLA